MPVETAPRPEIMEMLDAGERIIWSGRPRQGVIVHWWSLALCGVVIVVAIAVVFRVGSRLSVAAFPLALFGLWLIVAPFVMDATRRRYTFYALTNERVLIVSNLWYRVDRSRSLLALDKIELSQAASREGTILFGWSARMPIQPIVWPWQQARFMPSFEMIPDAAEVARLVREAQSAAIER